MDDEAVIEFTAQIAALRFLLEQAYANSFPGNPEAFKQFMASVRAAPSVRVLQAENAEQTLEIQARFNVHLERFETATLKRIQSAESSA